MTELKKCPFCGGEAELRKMHFNDWDTGEPYRMYSVGCGTCDCYGELSNVPIFHTKEEAAEAWNRRANNEIN